jgi:YHS domain-containing protein
MPALRLSALALLVAVAACGGPAKPPAASPAAPASAPAAAAAPGEAGHCGSPAKAEAGLPVAFTTPPPEGLRARCPVSGELVVVGQNTPRSEYQGKHYVFCCPGCKKKFDADPGKYAAQ